MADSAEVISGIGGVWALFSNFFLILLCNISHLRGLSYRDSFNNLPQESIGDPNAKRNRLQIVSGLSFHIGVLQQALAISLFHNNKWPKSLKKQNYEYSLLVGAFPEQAEGVSIEDFQECNNNYASQSNMACYIYIQDIFY